MNATLALISETDPALNTALQALTQALDLPLLDRESALKKHTNISNYDFLLGWLNTNENVLPPRLALFSKKTGPVFIDFLGGKKNHRRQFGGGKGQPLARAVGASAEHPPKLIDATAGMGGDAFVFATLGCDVLMIERSPVIAALLQDALNRAKTELKLEHEGQTTRFDAEERTFLEETIEHMSLVNADAADFLNNEKPDADVIYLDPMYPEKKKKAATNKEMTALQGLVGPDMDSSNLLEAALQVAKKRVVVKRPTKAEPIQLADGRLPSANIQSPNTRYDLYTLSRL
ncbi:class I SAM-dependent methyltransferase [Hydrogenovibrio kuenenii]|uniref:class I SAM-dependent methyltransferase n=1 Tax=Hydrogenovibrio kuenenii TaxID=63658 RepID=UPI000464A591|nr:class I SAM-dependent methyltransferase [Hydrogenovibrio kuenenii]